MKKAHTRPHIPVQRRDQRTYTLAPGAAEKKAAYDVEASSSDSPHHRRRNRRDTLFYAENYTGNKFYRFLISKRRKITEFDETHVAMVVPCFNEEFQVRETMNSINSELPELRRRLPLLTLFTIFFIVDGSGKDQLKTAICMLSCLKKLLDSPDERNLKGSRTIFQDMENAVDELQGVLGVGENLRSQKEKVEKLHDEMHEEKSVHYQKILATERSLNQFFVNHTEKYKSTEKYKFYPTKVLEYIYEFRTDLDPSFFGGRDDVVEVEMSSPTDTQMKYLNFNVSIALIVKQENRGKRDSLLLGCHRCLVSSTVPFALSFVDCDTSWKAGSLSRMVKHLKLGSDNTVGISGTIILRNNHWSNPLTNLEDFSYILSQIGAKEAENLFGMVTCLPGAFSILKLREGTTERVLLELTRHPVTLAEKNKIELGEDRYWTTLLLLRSLEKGDAVVRHLRHAVAETEAPDDLLTYYMQQRRWINSTVLNYLSGLLPALNQHCCECNSFSRFFGSLYLSTRTLLEHFGFFLSPSICGIFFETMFRDIGLAPGQAKGIAISILFLALLFALLFEKPKDYPVLFRIYTYLNCILTAILSFLWLYHAFSSMIGKHSGNRHISDVEYYRFVIVIMFFAFILLLSAAHSKLRQTFSPPWKPLVYLSFIGITFVFLPTFSLFHLADFSWGNRDSKAAATAEETKSAEKLTNYLFLMFVFCNIVFYVSCDYFLDSDEGFAFLMLFVYLLGSMGITFLLSLISAVKQFCRWASKPCRSDNYFQLGQGSRDNRGKRDKKKVKNPGGVNTKWKTALPLDDHT